MTAIWHFIGPRPPPTDTQGQPNLLNIGRLDGGVHISGMITPRSVHTEREPSMRGSPGGPSEPEIFVRDPDQDSAGGSGSAQSGTNAPAGTFPTFPLTYTDSCRWLESSDFAMPERDAWKSEVFILPDAPKYPYNGRSDFAYIANTELADGRQALLVDPGSFNNLSGAEWVRRTAVLGSHVGRTSSQAKREHPLRIDRQQEEQHF